MIASDVCTGFAAGFVAGKKKNNSSLKVTGRKCPKIHTKKPK